MGWAGMGKRREGTDRVDLIDTPFALVALGFYPAAVQVGKGDVEAVGTFRVAVPLGCIVEQEGFFSLHGLGCL
jgi:hypothetical protein